MRHIKAKAEPRVNASFFVIPADGQAGDWHKSAQRPSLGSGHLDDADSVGLVELEASRIGSQSGVLVLALGATRLMNRGLRKAYTRRGVLYRKSFRKRANETHDGLDTAHGHPRCDAGPLAVRGYPFLVRDDRAR